MSIRLPPNPNYSMHPFVKILLFMTVLALLGIINAQLLSVMLAILLVMIVLLKHRNYWHILLRLRWLFLSILIIYAFGTPGELLPYFPVQFAPSYEGVSLGIIQLERLLIALAALHLLLTASPRQEMMLGLYWLLLPLKYLGLNVERFAARLMLTLHYVESFAESTKHKLNFDALDDADTNMTETAMSEVHIQQRSFRWLDKIVIAAIIVLMLMLAYWNMR